MSSTLHKIDHMSSYMTYHPTTCAVELPVGVHTTEQRPLVTSTSFGKIDWEGLIRHQKARTVHCVNKQAYLRRPYTPLQSAANTPRQSARGERTASSIGVAQGESVSSGGMTSVTTTPRYAHQHGVPPPAHTRTLSARDNWQQTSNSPTRCTRELLQDRDIHERLPLRDSASASSSHLNSYSSADPNAIVVQYQPAHRLHTPRFYPHPPPRRQ